MQVTLTEGHAASFAELASLVARLSDVGIRGFVLDSTDEHMLHVALRNANRLEECFETSPRVETETLVQFHSLVRQLHRATADGLLDPKAVPYSLLDTQQAVEEYLQEGGIATDVSLGMHRAQPTSPDAHPSPAAGTPPRGRSY